MWENFVNALIAQLPIIIGGAIAIFSALIGVYGTRWAHKYNQKSEDRKNKIKKLEHLVTLAYETLIYIGEKQRNYVFSEDVVVDDKPPILEMDTYVALYFPDLRANQNVLLQTINDLNEEMHNQYKLKKADEESWFKNEHSNDDYSALYGRLLMDVESFVGEAKIYHAKLVSE